MSGLDEILPWILDNINPKDYDTFNDWLNAIDENFETRYPRAKGIKDIFDFAEMQTLENAYYSLSGKSTQEEIQTYIDEEFEEPLTEEKRDIIQDITRQPTTKNTQTIETLETIKRPVTLKEFINLTGMVPSTARRELGVGVRKGLFTRISKGVYQI